MAYFLKQTPGKDGRTYLSIVNSFYSAEKRGTAHKVHKSLKSIEYWKAHEIENPVAHFQEEVDRLNAELEKEREETPQITEQSSSFYMGYFPIKCILDKLNVKKYMDPLTEGSRFEYDLYDVLTSLVYARLVAPCGKFESYNEVMPSLFHRCDCSYDQLLSGVEFLGSEYEKFAEIFDDRINRVYGSDTSTTYLVCTNFYFEMDREDDFRKKGPGKEGRHEPIVGLGLLLDGNEIPIGMRMYPGNQSEKPVLRQVVEDLKSRKQITGRTVVVADKGLNCAANIIAIKKNKDGYLFSKSVKGLSSKEKKWVLLQNDYQDVCDENGVVLYKYKECVDEFEYEVTLESGGVVTHKYWEKRIATYNPTLARKQRREINKMVSKAKGLVFSGVKKEEYGDAGKYINITGSDGETAIKSINQEAINKDLSEAGYNLLVTSEYKMDALEIYKTYHNLWRIEEAFKIMKSDIESRPVFLQKEDSIKGHFLICYLAILLERIFEYKVLEDNYSYTEIVYFFKDFNVVKIDYGRYANTAHNKPFIRALAEKFELPLTNLYLSEKKIKSIFNTKI